jgi:hypothetical protein
MPPWLVELLMQHNSKGFVDSLSTLVGAQPQYVQLADRRLQNGNMGSGYFVDNQGNHSIGITPNTMRNFNVKGASNYPGYRAVDKKQKLGDQVLGHEFGHLAMFGAGGNAKLQEDLSKIIPDVYDEKAMDDFQNSVQFLRNGQTDTTKLSPRQALITNVLLQQPIYKQHPINQRRVLENILAGLFSQPKL